MPRPIRHLFTAALSMLTAVAPTAALALEDGVVLRPVRVRYADLDPLSTADAAALHVRIEAAASRGCIMPVRRDPLANPRRARQECRAGVVADALAALPTPHRTAVLAHMRGAATSTLAAR